jgi:hypothetical protein
MKKLFILMLLLPTFAMAQSGAVFKLIANDGQADKEIIKDSAQSKTSTSTSAPTFNAPTIPATTTDNPEKSVAKKEVEVAKREVSAASAEVKPSVAVPFGQRFIPEAAEQKSQTAKTDAQKAQMKANGNPLDSVSKTVAKP